MAGRESLWTFLLRARLGFWRFAQRCHEKTPNWPRRHRLSSFLANRHIESYFDWEKATKV